MDGTRIEGRRRIAHALALSLVLLGALACRVVGEGSASAVNHSAPDEALTQVDSSARSTAVPDPTVVPTREPSRFAPAIERWRPLSRDAAQTAQEATGVRLDENLLLALVAAESDGKPGAHSPRGAVGLAQVEPATFEDLRMRYSGLLAGGSLAQPRVNLLAGALYLADCARVLGADVADPGDLALVLHAYNMGPRAAAEWRDTGFGLNQTPGGAQLERQLPAETAEHATRIMAAISAAGV